MRHIPRSPFAAACLGLLLATTAAGPAAASERWVTAPDGQRIAVTTRGGGEATLLFVHCWSCDRGTWGDLPSRLADAYRIVSVDLPGHGASDRDRETWSIAGYGADVAAVIDTLGLERVVLVGHSMGGPVSLEAARLRREKVLGIVAVDTLQDVDFGWSEEQLTPFLESFRADFPTACAGFVRLMTVPESTAEHTAQVEADLCDADPEIAIALLDDIFHYDTTAALAAAGVPVRGINSAAFPTDFATNRRHGDYDAVIVPGVGHFLHLEKPLEIEQHLRRWAGELAPAPEDRFAGAAVEDDGEH